MFGFSPAEKALVEKIAAERGTTIRALVARGYYPLRETRFDKRRPRLIGLTTGGWSACVDLVLGQTRHYQRIGDSLTLTGDWTPGDDQF